MDIKKANQEAAGRMMEARPVVTGMGKALDVIPGMREDLLLHAGRIPVPSSPKPQRGGGSARRSGLRFAGSNEPDGTPSRPGSAG